jgi:hypothetical protein
VAHVTLCDGHGVFFVAASGQIRIRIAANTPVCWRSLAWSFERLSSGCIGWMESLDDKL